MIRRSPHLRPCQGLLFHLLDERVLAIHIGFDVVGELLGELSLELRILLGNRCMRPQIIRKRQVAENMRRTRPERMELMGPPAVRTIASEIPAARNAEFAHGLISQRRQIGHDAEHIDDRLGPYPRYGSAADMVDFEQILAQRSGDLAGNQRECRWPSAIVGNDQDTLHLRDPN